MIEALKSWVRERFLRWQLDTIVRYYQQDTAWKAIDTRALKAYLSSSSGIKLWRILNNTAIAKNASAMRRFDNPNYFNGDAAGFGSAILVLKNMAEMEIDDLASSEENEDADEDEVSSAASNNQSRAPR